MPKSPEPIEQNRTRPWTQEEMILVDGVFLGYYAQTPGEIIVWLPGTVRTNDSIRPRGVDPAHVDHLRTTGHHVVMPMRLRLGQHGL